MNRQEFESAIKNPIVTPITSVITSANFQDAYSPEDMIKYLTGANNSLVVRKKSAGLNTSIYWTFTHNNGYIQCTITDVATYNEIFETGENMNFLESITAWFDEHQKVRVFVKMGVISALGFFVAESNEITALLPDNLQAFAGPLITGLFGMLLLHAQQTTKWPIVGAKVCKKNR
ncbi:MAG: hypothetical protein WC451_02600 [Patescibacteria group bacterium]|jgi:hypothetical protein